MSQSEEVKNVIMQLSAKVDLHKLLRLEELVPELKDLDELVGHNAETARDQLKTKAEPLLGAIPGGVRESVINLLSRVDANSVLIAVRMLDYYLLDKAVLYVHIDDFLDHTSDIPLLDQRVISQMQRFLQNNPEVHLVVMSHDTADVTSVLATALVGAQSIHQGQVSMVYESGLGLYSAAPAKEKKNYAKETRVELMHILERMAVAAATRVSDKKFKERFYFSATEYSLGIRVHPYARGSSNSIDKDAAHELVEAVAVALADLVKEDLKAVQSHAINYFLTKDPSLSTVFSPSHDEKVWDMEKVDELLQLFRFVHLGSRGSMIRPADATDIEAAEAVLESLGAGRMILVASDNHFTLPLFEWALGKKNAFIACSDQAEKQIRELVETRGGIEYAAGKIEELLNVVDAYIHLKKVVK